MAQLIRHATENSSPCHEQADASLAQPDTKGLQELVQEAAAGSCSPGWLSSQLRMRDAALELSVSGALRRSRAGRS